MVRKAAVSVRGENIVKFKSVKDFVEVYNAFIRSITEYQDEEEILIAFNLELERLNKYEINSMKSMRDIFNKFIKTYDLSGEEELSYVNLVQKYKLDVTSRFTYTNFIKSKPKCINKSIDINKEIIKTYKEQITNEKESKKEEVVPVVTKEEVKVEESTKEEVEEMELTGLGYIEYRMPIVFCNMIEIFNDYELNKEKKEKGELLTELVDKYNLVKHDYSENSLYMKIDLFRTKFAIPEGFIIKDINKFLEFHNLNRVAYEMFDSKFLKDYMFITPMNLLRSIYDETVENVNETVVSEENKTEEVHNIEVNGEDDIALNYISKISSIRTKMKDVLDNCGMSLDELEKLIRDYKKSSEVLNRISKMIEEEK